MAKSSHLWRNPHIRSRSTHLHTSEALHICSRPHICDTSCHTSANVKANRLAHLCTFACTRPKPCTSAHVGGLAHLHTSVPVEVRRPAPERCAPKLSSRRGSPPSTPAPPRAQHPSPTASEIMHARPTRAPAGARRQGVGGQSLGVSTPETSLRTCSHARHFFEKSQNWDWLQFVTGVLFGVASSVILLFLALSLSFCFLRLF